MKTHVTLVLALLAMTFAQCLFAAQVFFDGAESYTGGTQNPGPWSGYGSAIGVFCGANESQAHTGTNFIYTGSGISWGAHTVHTWSSAQDFQLLDDVTVWVWAPSNDPTISLYLRFVDSDSPDQDSIMFQASAGTVQGGWNATTKTSTGDFTKTGAAEWDDINRLVICTTSTGSDPDSVLRYDDISISVIPEPAVLAICGLALIRGIRGTDPEAIRR